MRLRPLSHVVCLATLPYDGEAAASEAPTRWPLDCGGFLIRTTVRKATAGSPADSRRDRVAGAFAAIYINLTPGNDAILADHGEAACTEKCGARLKEKRSWVDLMGVDAWTASSWHRPSGYDACSCWSRTDDPCTARSARKHSAPTGIAKLGLRGLEHSGSNTKEGGGQVSTALQQRRFAWSGGASEAKNHARNGSQGKFVKGLVVDEPWISLLLSGEKIWEMRSQHCSFRGRLALIRKGSGTVVGVADLVDSIGPLDSIAWRAHRDKHCIPLARQAETSGWNVAWVLRSVRRLVQPVSYAHPSGAVIWVNLSDEVASRIEVAHGQSPSVKAVDGRVLRTNHAYTTIAPAVLPLGQLVPVAKDGSWFSLGLARATGFTVGAKGSEKVFAEYHDALRELRIMDAARWRRPNSKGNWGIVTAVRWESPDRLAIGAAAAGEP